MEHKIAEPNARVDVADVLRGLAVMGIILLHSIEPVSYTHLIQRLCSRYGYRTYHKPEISGERSPYVLRKRHTLLERIRAVSYTHLHTLLPTLAVLNY